MPPGSPRRGDVIEGVEEALAIPWVTVYHSGTRLADGRLVTDGGRVLSVCGRGATLTEAVATAYRGVDRIRFDGAQARRDIGADSVARLGGVGAAG